MNRSVYVLGIAALVMGTTLLRADPVDPVYSMGDPTAGVAEPNPNFNFTADSNGGGIFQFTNTSGELWDSFTVSVTLPSGDQITILPGPFFNTNAFSSIDLGGGMSRYTIGLFNTGVGSGGIASNESFTINLNDLINGQQGTDVNGAGGWGANTSFAATGFTGPTGTNLTPEPASILLLLTGLGLVWFGRQRFRRASFNPPAASRVL